MTNPTVTPTATPTVNPTATMQMHIRRQARRVENIMVGEIESRVRSNMHTEIIAAMLFGTFMACLSFIPVLLRKMGAPQDWIALYVAQQFLGFMLNPLAVMILPKRRGVMRACVIMWCVGRGTFGVAAFVNGYEALVAILIIFWLFEALPTPLYTRIMQAVYPASSRGRVMGLIRVGMAGMSLAATPIIGWVLDNIGGEHLLPISTAGLSLSLAPLGGWLAATTGQRLVLFFGAVLAVMSALIFSRMRLNETAMDASELGASGVMGMILKEDKRFKLYMLGVVCFGFGHLTAFALYPLVQVDRLNLSYSAVGLLNTINALFFLGGYMVMGRMIDRRGGVWSLRLVYGIGLIIPLCYALAVEGWHLAPAFAALGIVMAGLDLCLLNTVMELGDPKKLGEYTAIQTSLLGIRGLIAPFFGVFLLNSGFSQTTIFLLGAGLIALAVIILGYAVKMPPTPFLVEGQP